MNKLLFLVLAVMWGLVWVMGSHVMEWEFVPTPPALVAGVAAGKKVEAAATNAAPQAAGEPVAPRLVLPSPKQPLKVVVDDLAIVRGTVVKEMGGLLIVECEPNPAPRSGFTPMVDAMTGAGGIAAAAKWAMQVEDEQIEREFGKLQRVPAAYGDEVRERCKRVIGTFVVHGYSGRRDRLNVVAAPTGQYLAETPVYTLNYTVQSRQAAARQHSVFPPGVDTPEQRREYLEWLTEQRREKAGR